MEGLKNLHQSTERNPIAHVIVIFYPWKMLFFQNLPFKQMLPNYIIFSFYNWVPHFFFCTNILLKEMVFMTYFSIGHFSSLISTLVHLFMLQYTHSCIMDHDFVMHILMVCKEMIISPTTMTKSFFCGRVKAFTSKY